MSDRKCPECDAVCAGCEDPMCGSEPCPACKARAAQSAEWVVELPLGIGRERWPGSVPPRPPFPEKFAEAPGPARLAAIEERARKNFALRTCGNLLDGIDDVVRAVQDDVPRLLSEVKRLRAKLPEGA